MQSTQMFQTTLAEPSKWASLTGGLVCARYDLLAQVGAGGMGVVYKARHRQLGAYRAIKVTQPGASIDRFLHEARLLAAIRSPHVVAVHDFDVLADGCPMLVMEWVEGSDLAALLRAQRSPLPEDRALPWMRQVAAGMQAAAEHGITHRDLKPSNILIDQKDTARVADFGLARGLGEAPTSEPVVGTPHYMAPEQAETPHNVDTRADVYSFGATFYHVLTGSLPFEGDSVYAILFQHKTAPLAAPRSRNAALSERTSEVLERCLAKSPAERFASFADLLEHLHPGPASPWLLENDTGLARYIAQFHERRALYLQQPRSLEEPDVYEFPRGRRLLVVSGNIVHQQVDALVSSDDEFLSMRAGVSRAICDAAGAQMMAEQTRRYGRVRPGRAVVTPAGRLPARFVFHGVTLAFRDDQPLRPSRDLIIEILHSCLYHADSLHLESLALPLLGTGTAQFSPEVCLDTTFQFLARTLLRGLTSVREARIVLFG